MKLGKDSCIIIASLVIIAIVMMGEVVTYASPYRYSASAEVSGEYSISDSGSHVYDAILSDNGSFSSPQTFYLLYDEDYGTVVRDVTIETGSRQLDQEYYVSQLTNNLRYYGISVQTVDVAQAASVLSDVSSASGTAMIMLAGAIPDTIYGPSSTLLLDWISAGGSLYWAGGMLGRYVSHSDGTVTEADAGYQSLFLGAECLNPEENDEDGRVGTAHTVILAPGNDYATHLSLKNNRVLYGVDSTALTVPNLMIGYSEGAYSSVAFVKKDAGMVCVVAGDYSNEQRMDLATVIASGLCYSSVEVEHHRGQVTRETVSGTFERMGDVTGNASVFVYLGGEYSVYGKNFGF